MKNDTVFLLQFEFLNIIDCLRLLLSQADRKNRIEFRYFLVTPMVSAYGVMT